MKKRTSMLNLLIVSMLALSAMGAGRYQPAEGGKSPSDARSFGIPEPVLESELNIPSAPMTQGVIRSFLPKMSGGSAYIIAGGGKTPDNRKTVNGSSSGLDNPVSVDAKFQENQPSMAVNPTNEQIVVVFNHYFDNDTGTLSCLATSSFDGGDTFSYTDYVILPVLNAGDECSNPVVRFSPDGEFAYYFFVNLYGSTGGTTSDIVLQKASGTNPTALIGAPIVVFEGGTDLMDKEWGDVHTYDQYKTGGIYAGTLYVSATKLYSSGDCAIVFNVSYDYGATWTYAVDNPLALDYRADCFPVVVQGSRPIGGNDGFMMVCWYDSHTDGYGTGSFYIDCRANDNYGGDGNWFASFSPGGLRKYELALQLGPNGTYHSWRGAMYPALAVDEEGMAYIAFTSDPTANQSDAEAGSVYLTYRRLNSTVATAWKTPIAVGGGANAQGYATVAARYDPSTNKYMVFVAYGDYVSSNKSYNTVYRKGTRSPVPVSGVLPAVVFGPKVKVNDRISMSDSDFIGEYIDSALTARRYHIAWTDRADAYAPSGADDDVLHDVFVP